MRIAELIPPILHGYMQRVWQAPRAYPSYEAARAACGQSYDSSRLAEVVVAKTVCWRDNLARQPAKLGLEDLRAFAVVVAALDAVTDLRVVDFGGAAGASYFLIKRLMGERLKLRWAVVETPAMARAAALLASSELTFHAGLDEAIAALGRVDLMFSSSTLQYVPDPFATLRQLAAVRAPTLYLTRTGFLDDGPSVVQVQKSSLAANGPGPLPAGIMNAPIAYPLILESFREATKIVDEFYRIEAVFHESVHVFATSRGSARYFGILGRARA